LGGGEKSFDELENTTGYTATQNKMFKETRPNDKAVLYMLYRAVHESTFEKIVSASTSKEAQDILEKVFNGANRVK